MSPAVVLDPSTPDPLQLSLPQTNGANGIAHAKQTTLSTPLPNPSLQVTADHKLKQVDAPVLAPKIGEVLLHIKATGVCGYVTCEV